MSAANDFANDARNVKDQAKESAGKVGAEAKEGAQRVGAEAKEGAQRVGAEVRASAERVGEDASDELAKLRGQVERLMQERVTPALAGAADQVQDYANRARDSIEEKADAFSDTVRERPLTAVAIAAVTGYVIGRLLGGNTYVYPRDRH